MRAKPFSETGAAAVTAVIPVHPAGRERVTAPAAKGMTAEAARNKKIVFAIVNLREITKLRRYIELIDPHAFLFIMNTTDVIGRGCTCRLKCK